MVKIVFISDVHQRHEQITIPECDILISSGDYSFKGQLNEVVGFHRWMNKQPATHLISVQGNHEVGVEKQFKYFEELSKQVCPRVHFIDEGLVEIEQLKIWCSAVTPFFYNWAWNIHRGEPIKRHWDFIPCDTDILITHGPPAGILDKTLFGENVGCWDLFDKIKEVKPKIHCFGHIHPGYGSHMEDGILFLNASICNEDYEAVNLPLVVEINENKNVKLV